MLDEIEQWGGLALLAVVMLTIVTRLMYPTRRRRPSGDSGGGDGDGAWPAAEGEASHHSGDHVGFDGGHN